MIWDLLTSTQLAAVSTRVPVVLPLAATEQHGPHLPLATDRLIVERFCALLDRELTDRVLILPAVAVGCSEHHMDFSGSLSLRHDTFKQQVLDLLASVTTHGFTNLMLFNGHGGNVAIAQVVAEIFGRRNPEVTVVMSSWWQLAAADLLHITDTGPGGVGHACEFETSLMLAHIPEFVDRSAINKGDYRPTYDWAEGDLLRGRSAVLYRTFGQMTSNGVYGDPTAASAEKGRRIEEVVLAALTRLIHSLYDVEEAP